MSKKLIINSFLVATLLLGGLDSSVFAAKEVHKHRKHRLDDLQEQQEELQELPRKKQKTKKRTNIDNPEETKKKKKKKKTAPSADTTAGTTIAASTEKPRRKKHKKDIASTAATAITPEEAATTSQRPVDVTTEKRKKRKKRHRVATPDDCEEFNGDSSIVLSVLPSAAFDSSVHTPVGSKPKQLAIIPAEVTVAPTFPASPARAADPSAPPLPLASPDATKNSLWPPDPSTIKTALAGGAGSGVAMFVLPGNYVGGVFVESIFRGLGLLSSPFSFGVVTVVFGALAAVAIKKGIEIYVRKEFEDRGQNVDVANVELAGATVYGGDSTTALEPVEEPLVVRDDEDSDGATGQPQEKKKKKKRKKRKRERTEEDGDDL